MTAPIRDLAPSELVNAAGGQKSWTKVLCPIKFRSRFATYWSAFLRENYRNPEEVAVCFGVRFQTASNWWNAANRPSGDVVALADIEFQRFLEAQTCGSR
jgi:hypothetical protein